MEEDIKILEEEIKRVHKVNNLSGTYVPINILENLIKGYRELEEKYNNLKIRHKGAKEDLRVSEDLEKHFSEEASNLEAVLDNYIPKSKVLSIMRDIQERTEKLINTTYVPLSSRIYNDNKEKYEPMLIGRTIAMGALQSLQELMEDK